MITIQGFARLCGCNTQTLRYYDRIGLLTPAKVDSWTGYRYYEEEQAMQFVTIKNLQQADFSIDEIRPLLDASSERLQEAFERKITEQTQKLERIKTIQASYLKEKMEMQKTICMLADFMEGRMDNPKLWDEFGLDDRQGTELNARVHEVLADWLTQIRNASGEIARQANSQQLDAVKAVVDALAGGEQGEKKLIVSVSGADGARSEEIPADAETVFSCSGWAHVSDWLDKLPAPEAGRRSFLRFRVREDSPVCDPAFPTMMLAVMASRFDVMQDGVFCTVGRSDDGQNHLELLRK